MESRRRELELLNAITDDNINEAKYLINDLKVPIAVVEDNALHFAAVSGQVEMCKLLLDSGADVNAKNVHGASPLCMATLANRPEIVDLFMKYGARTLSESDIDKQAKRLLNDVPKERKIAEKHMLTDIMNYYKKTREPEEEPKLPENLIDPLLKLLAIENIHPVRLILYLQCNDLIFQNASKIIDVLKIISERCFAVVKFEIFALKFHHIAFVFSSAFKYLNSQKLNDENKSLSDKMILDALMKSWLNGQKKRGLSPTLDGFLREDISSYRFKLHCRIYKVNELLCMPSNSLKNFIDFINCYDSVALETCETCRDQSGLKKCSVCKSVQYCSKKCQSLHWFMHKTECKKM